MPKIITDLLDSVSNFSLIGHRKYRDLVEDMLAVDQPGDLADEMVFLGGCVTGLLVTDPAAPPFRATDDVDAIVQIFSVGSTT